MAFRRGVLVALPYRPVRAPDQCFQCGVAHQGLAEILTEDDGATGPTGPAGPDGIPPTSLDPGVTDSTGLDPRIIVGLGMDEPAGCFRKTEGSPTLTCTHGKEIPFSLRDDPFHGKGGVLGSSQISYLHERLDRVKEIEAVPIPLQIVQHCFIGTIGGGQGIDRPGAVAERLAGANPGIRVVGAPKDRKQNPEHGIVLSGGVSPDFPDRVGAGEEIPNTQAEVGAVGGSAVDPWIAKQ